MNEFDFDPEKLNQEANEVADRKAWLGVANNAANSILSAPSAADIMLGRKGNSVNVGLDRVADSISDPWEKQKKTYEAYKAAKDGEGLKESTDPNSKRAKALKLMISKKNNLDPASLGEMTEKDLVALYGDQGKLAEIQAQAQINLQNDLAKQRNSQTFQASENEKNRQAELEKERTKKENENSKKLDPRNLSGTDKARFDNALMVAKAIDDMGAALDAGDNTFSMVGDNTYTEAERKAAEAYGRMQSGGAINKEEEVRFLKMLPRSTDSKEMQRLKLTKQREEMLSRLNTLGFKPSDIGYQPKEFAYGKASPAGNKANASSKPTTIRQNGHVYTLNPQTGEYE